MAEYRTLRLDSFNLTSKIEIDRAESARVDAELHATRARYESLLFDSFPGAYFEQFRVGVFGATHDAHTPDEVACITSITRRLGEQYGASIVTGGGSSGMMLAAAAGLAAAKAEAQKAGKPTSSQNIGVMMDFAPGERPNNLLDVTDKTNNFSTRIEEFIRITHGAYIAPGGIGTRLEATMFFQLKQLGWLEASYPVVAHPFWKPMVEQSHQLMFTQRVRDGKAPLTGPNDLAFLRYSDDVEEVVAIFGEAHKAWLKLREKVAWKPAGK